MIFQNRSGSVVGAFKVFVDRGTNEIASSNNVANGGDVNIPLANTRTYYLEVYTNDYNVPVAVLHDVAWNARVNFGGTDLDAFDPQQDVGPLAH